MARGTKAQSAEIETRSAEEVLQERKKRQERTIQQLEKVIQLGADARYRELGELCENIRVETQRAIRRLTVKREVDGELQAFVGGALEQVVSSVEKHRKWNGILQRVVYFDELAIWQVTTLQRPGHTVYMTAAGEFVYRNKLRDWKREVVFWEHSNEAGYSFQLVDLDELLGPNGHIETRLGNARLILEGVKRIGVPL